METNAIIAHKLCSARQLCSPNQSDRTNADNISLLVIHNISLPPGEFGTGCVDKLFCNKLDFNEHEYFQKISGLQVSSHLLIDRQGRCTQYVPFDKKAWHAGQSCFQGRDNCNDYSIGIELEGTDFEQFTQKQYHSLVAVTRLLLEKYPQLSIDRIVGHSDIAPGRKSDPGPFFDWQGFRAALASG